MPTPTPGPADGHGPDADHAGPSTGLEQAEREQARVYVDLAGRMPRWYLLAVGGIVTVQIASWDLGLGLAQVALFQLSLVAFIALVVTLRRRNGITGLRLRKLPGSLRRAFLPLAGFGLVVLPVVGAATWLEVRGDPNISFLALGLASGVGLTLAAIWSWRRFTVAAGRLADAVGADR